MNITRENVNELNAVVSVKVVPEDYTQRVEDLLKDYRKKARVDGFRPGMVPMGMIKRMFYKPILADEINKIISENLMRFIQEEKLRILGEPLPHEGQKPVDFDNDKEFEVSFDLGLAPEFNLNISSEDKIPYFDITVEDKVIEEYIENLAKRFGHFTPVEVSTGNELVKASLTAVDENNSPVEGGLNIEDASFSLDMMQDEDVKKQFTGIKAGDKVVFDVRKAYPNDTDIAGLLHITKDKAAEIAGHFEATVKEISKFEKHEINQEFYDHVYGEGEVKSDEEFRNKVVEQIKSSYERESNYKFALDARDYLLTKANLTLPADFLKRWLLATNEKMTAEQIESEFGDFESEFKWQLIKDQAIRENNITVSNEELFDYGMLMARNQFYQYGLYNVADEHLEKFVNEQLSRPEDSRRLRDQKLEEKVIFFMKETVTLEKQEVSMEDFKKLFEK